MFKHHFRQFRKGSWVKRKALVISFGYTTRFCGLTVDIHKAQNGHGADNGSQSHVDAKSCTPRRWWFCGIYMTGTCWIWRNGQWPNWWNGEPEWKMNYQAILPTRILFHRDEMQCRHKEFGKWVNG